MVDRFPEAFERFEQVVDVRGFRSYRQLAYAFTHWAGRRWIDSYAQNVALRREAEKRGFKVARIPKYFRKPQVSARRTWRYETVTVRGKPQVRHRDLKTGRFVKRPK
jgi:hypothetical protein